MTLPLQFHLIYICFILLIMDLLDWYCQFNDLEDCISLRQYLLYNYLKCYFFFAFLKIFLKKTPTNNVFHSLAQSIMSEEGGQEPSSPEGQMLGPQTFRDVSEELNSQVQKKSSAPPRLCVLVTGRCCRGCGSKWRLHNRWRMASVNNAAWRRLMSCVSDIWVMSRQGHSVGEGEGREWVVRPGSGPRWWPSCGPAAFCLSEDKDQPLTPTLTTAQYTDSPQQLPGLTTTLTFRSISAHYRQGRCIDALSVSRFTVLELICVYKQLKSPKWTPLLSILSDCLTCSFQRVFCKYLNSRYPY